MIASWLFERLKSYRDETAIVFRDGETSYARLLELTLAWHAELARHELGAGSVVLVEGGFSPQAVSLLLALVERAAVAVPLTPASRVHRPDYEAISEAAATIVFDDADRFSVVRHERTVRNALTQKLVLRRSPGLVIFSSGSTGKPKAVLHDFGALLAKFERRGAKKRTLSFLLFDHIGGIDTLFNTLANGGTLVTVPNRDPDVVCTAVEKHRVHTLPTSPTFLNLLMISDAWRHHDLSSLELIAYGTEPMPASLLGRLREAFPKTTLLQTYGMSELGVLRTRSKDNDSLWIRFSNEGFETKIVDGTLWVRAPTAMLGYLNAPDLLDADGWLDTEDAVEVDGEYLKILGRATDLVNVGGQKVYPAEVENILLEMTNVRDAAVYGEPNPLLGKVLAARVNLIEPEPLEDFKKRLRAFCRTRLPNYKIPARIELTDREQFGDRLKKLRPRTNAPGGRER